MKICYAVSEVSPYAKTGGLADVAGSLPRQLARSGHDVRVFMPLYGAIDREAHRLRPADVAQDVRIELGSRPVNFSLWTPETDAADATDARPDATLYLVDCPELFGGDELYPDSDDEPLRFAMLCRAVLDSCQQMVWGPDVLHCNDWHTSLVPLMLRTIYDWDGLFSASRTVLTIHNIGYQGVFPADAAREVGLDNWYPLFDQEDLQRGVINFLRTGLLYCDAVTTVSPTYAREIQSPNQGMGLEALLQARGPSLVGILNGVDYEEWNPESDRHIPHHFDIDNLEGKRKNKRALLDQSGLDPDPEVPLFGIVSRLTHQKGFELCAEVLPSLLARDRIRVAVVGTGEERYERFFQELHERFPRRVAFYRGFNNELAHLVEAACDMFLMPSRYEPCGLNQMFSLRYGTIPIVRRTGGLADSVQQYDHASGEGTGFVFEHFTAEGLLWAMDLALETYHDRRSWERLMRNAMSADFSWQGQAQRYEEVYGSLLEADQAKE